MGFMKLVKMGFPKNGKITFCKFVEVWRRTACHNPANTATLNDRMMRSRALPVGCAVVRDTRTLYPRRPIPGARQSSSSASVVRKPEQRRGDEQADAELEHLRAYRAAPVLSCLADQLNSLRQRGYCVVARSPRLGQGELAVCYRSVHISCRSML